MPLNIVRNDITKMQVDAIVNAAKESLLGGGGVDGAIHRSAGPALLEACRALGGCPTGSAKATLGYALPCRYIIHTVGPVWQGGYAGEKALLTSCYRSSLALARELGCESIAFPLISSGVYGYPKDKALRVAVDTIADFLMEQDMQVYLVVFDRSALQISGKLFSSIQSFIDDNYVDQFRESRRERLRQMPKSWLEDDFCYEAPCEAAMPEDCDSFLLPEKACVPQPMDAGNAFRPLSLDEALGMIDESFSEMLLRKIGEKGISDSQCYKKANIDRKLFSKIRSDKGYKPSKPTVLAFAIALELPLSETRDMLQKAGFALSRSNKFDIIVEYFIRMGNYNIFEINEALFAFDQVPLG